MLDRVRVGGHSVCIRAGTINDVPDVLQLWQQAAAAPTITDTAEGLRELLRFDPRALLVAQADREIIGSLIATWNGWRGSLYRLAVRPGFHRQGLGIAMLRAGEDRLRRRGAHRVDAFVDADDSGAIAFWQASAYTRQPHRSRFVRNLVEH